MKRKVHPASRTDAVRFPGAAFPLPLDNHTAIFDILNTSKSKEQRVESTELPYRAAHICAVVNGSHYGERKKGHMADA